MLDLEREDVDHVCVLDVRSLKVNVCMCVCVFMCVCIVKKYNHS
jgi:hypothetical protein